MAGGPAGVGGAGPSGSRGLSPEVLAFLHRRKPNVPLTEVEQHSADLSRLAHLQTLQILKLFSVTGGNTTLTDLALAGKGEPTSAKLVNYIAIADKDGEGSIALKNPLTYDQKKGKLIGLSSKNKHKIELFADDFIARKDLKELAKKDPKYQVIRARAVVEKALGYAYTNYVNAGVGQGPKAKQKIANNMKGAINALATIRLPKKPIDITDDTRDQLIHCIILIDAVIKKSSAPVDTKILSKFNDLKRKIEESRPEEKLKLDDLSTDLMNQVDEEIAKIKPKAEAPAGTPQPAAKAVA